MVNHNVLDEILESLEKQINELRHELRHNTISIEMVFTRLRELFEKTSELLELDTELENKRRIYEHIANFLNKKFGNDIAPCREATYLLCQEEDPRLLSKNFPSKEAERIALTAKEHILAIKVHYTWRQELEICDCKTEIFSHKPSDEKPIITRIEEELSWDVLPPDIRATFIRNENQGSIGFELYP